MPPSPKIINERQDQLSGFCERFAQLAALLNEASHYGPSQRQEREYAELRAWMLAHYGDVRRHLTPYLDEGHRYSVYGGSDALEGLICAPTLGELLRCDDGRLPARVRSVEDALGLYQAHLLALTQASRG
ncbi:MAG: hypothetical protein K1X67_17840 [Fimbriimonadaceae bacterium]|nr:hypothetical protein [Fimbriimonadaceae bacterium]